MKNIFTVMVVASDSRRRRHRDELPRGLRKAAERVRVCVPGGVPLWI
jgi:hypothetical protein